MSGIINFFISCAGGLIKGVISHAISGGGSLVIGGVGLNAVCSVLSGLCGCGVGGVGSSACDFVLRLIESLFHFA